jgi:class 3 adenylate cyclase
VRQSGIGTATATICFTDIVASTAMLTRLGEDAWHDLRAEHDSLVRAAIESNRGTVVKHGGDGVMAAFASASDAVGAACEVQRSIVRRNQRAREPIEVRIGLAAGDVRTEDDDYFGTPVVEAARLCAAAQGGEILVADIVRLLTGSHGGYRFEPSAPMSLAGFDEPRPVARVVWETRAPAAVPLPPRLASSGAFTFVGRAGVLDSLQRAWKRAAAGESPVVLIAGEPGIGKSRCCAEIARDAHEGGALILMGECGEDAGSPYQPFVDALRYDLGMHAITPDVRLGPLAGELVALAPELHDELPPSSLPPAPDADSARRRVHDAIAGWLAVATTEQPVVLVLEDLHWASTPALQLVRHLVRAAIPGLFLLGTYRTTDLDRTHPLASTLADFRREPNVERITLSGLDEAEVVTLVTQAAGHHLEAASEELARTIARETNGNPFFVSEVILHLVESGRVYRKDGQWTSDLDIDSIGIPEGVREVVGRRLDRLGDDANLVLRAAAVVGAQFDLALLESLPDLPALALDALERAAAAGLVNEEGAGHYTFAHAIVRHTLLDETSGARRLRIHRDIAGALEVRTDRESRRARAHHLLAAATLTDLAEVAASVFAAVDDLDEQRAWEESAELCRRLLEVLDLTPQPTLRIDTLMRLSDAYAIMYDSPKARATLLEAARAAAAIGDHARTALALAFLSGVLDPMTPELEAVALAERVLPEVDPADATTRTALLLALVMARAMGVTAGDAGPAVDEVETLLPRVEHPETRNHATLAIGFYGLGLAELGVVERAVDRLALAADEAAAAEMRSSLEDAMLPALSTYLACFLALRRGDRDAFRSLRARLAVTAEETTAGLFKAQLAQWQALDAMLDGDLALADRLAGEVVPIVPEAVGFYAGELMQRTWIRALRGAYEEALPLVDTLAAFPLQSAMTVLRAWTLTFAGDDATARAVLPTEAAAAVCDEPRTWLWPGTIALVADLAHRRRDPDLARAVFDALAPFDGQMILYCCTHVIGSAATFLAKLDDVLDRPDDATRRYESGLALEEAMHAPALAARTRAAMEAR